MHWDGAISIGNVLTFLGMLGAMLWGFNQFTSQHTKAIAEITNAINNLSVITDRLDKQVQIQNGRLVKVETVQAVQMEVERRMAVLEQPRELAIRAVREEVDKRMAALGHPAPSV
jgi:hypothetical protein